MGSPGQRRADTRTTIRRRLEGVGFWRQQLRRVVLPTVGVGALAVASAAVVAQADDPETAPRTERVSVAASEVSRAGERPELATQAEVAQQVSGVVWVATTTDVRSDASADAPVLAQVAADTQVIVTGVVEGEWTQVLHNDLPRWVLSSALSALPPLGTGPCEHGSGVEQGLQPDTVKVYRAVCAKFPQITSYGGMADRMEHNTGHALDIMVTGELGDEVVAFLMENANRLGVEQLIWEQQIWEPGGSWRGMSDRGSATANHFDHVDVTTYGDSATG
ncbi:MAG: SH3 domain-containing protein [Aeromicrobium sp.]|uniref:SH3 domain-containing protein n=1 Tax=Aeromicrobium sp. TaxID=1871063 RepID=UPI0039E5919C